MTTVISADVSYFQKKVDNSYPRQWLIFRCCDGDFMDPNATFNANWARGAVIQGKLLGWSTYVVYRPGENSAVLANLAKIVPVDRVMVDVESWGGAIRGDHSDDVNELLDDLASIVGQDHVWLYGNLSNLNEICPRRRPWAKLVIASWGANKPNVANMVGWQYTDGAHPAGDRPLSSAPFGACDHNEIYLDAVGPLGSGTLIEPEDDGLNNGDIYNFFFAPIAAPDGRPLNVTGLQLMANALRPPDTSQEAFQAGAGAALWAQYQSDIGNAGKQKQYLDSYSAWTVQIKAAVNAVVASLPGPITPTSGPQSGHYTFTPEA